MHIESWRGTGKKEMVIAIKETFQGYLGSKEGFQYIQRVSDNGCAFLL